MSRTPAKKSVAKKPPAVAETEPKKRGRKRKSELTNEQQWNPETGSEQIELEPEIATEPVRDVNKVTRSGRISKPRPRDLDMVRFNN